MEANYTNNEYPDYIVLRVSPDNPDKSMDGEWLDRRQMPYLEAAIQLHGMKLTPSGILEQRDDGYVGEVWDLAIS